MSDNQSKVVVLLSDDEHKMLKQIAAESRRTLGQELAFRAFQEIAKLEQSQLDRRRRKSNKVPA